SLRCLHPFPTRRSSDLARTGRARARGGRRRSRRTAPPRPVRVAAPAWMPCSRLHRATRGTGGGGRSPCRAATPVPATVVGLLRRSEEHTSELQSRENIV